MILMFYNCFRGYFCLCLSKPAVIYFEGNVTEEEKVKLETPKSQESLCETLRKKVSAESGIKAERNLVSSNT